MRSPFSDETIFFLKLANSHRAVVLAVVVLSVIGSAFDGISIGMLVPLLGRLQGVTAGEGSHKFTQWLYGISEGHSFESQVLIAVSFVVLAMLLKNAMLAAATKLSIWLSTKVEADLRNRAWEVLFSVDLGFHHRQKQGRLLEQANGLPSRVAGIMLEVTGGLTNLLTLMALSVLLYVLSWQLALLTAGLGLVHALLSSAYLKRLSGPSERNTQVGLAINGKSQESLAGIELIKAYGREERVGKQLRHLIDEARQLKSRIRFRGAIMGWTTDILGALAIAILFMAALKLYGADGKQMIAHLLPFLYVITRLVPLARFLNAAQAAVISEWPALRHANALLRTDDKPFPVDGHNPFTELNEEIRFSDVCFSYHDDNDIALKHASFSIPKGRTTAIVGRSGAGKTTVVNLLMRFYDPQVGEILVDGTPLQGHRIAEYRKKIGIVSQDTFIFHDSVKANIAFGLDEMPLDNIVVAAARKAGAHQFIEALPDGYDTILGDRGVRLSGGQKQRISIARAILRDPEILILDEATSALDNITEKQIHDAILELSRDRTVIIIAHRLSTVRNADQIVVLKNGSVEQVGSEQYLSGTEGEYVRLAAAK